VFPAWYKPYSLNYQGEGYFLLFFGLVGLFGYSYMNDIKEQKGRKVRKVFDRGDRTKGKIIKEIRMALNRNEIGQHLKTARLVPLSKNKGSDIARVNEIRPIAVKSHLFKIMERAVENKLKESGSRLLKCDGYQNGFKEGRSTANNLEMILRECKKGKRQDRNKAEHLILIDI
jgi:hypothetical protein